RRLPPRRRRDRPRRGRQRGRHIPPRPRPTPRHERCQTPFVTPHKIVTCHDRRMFGSKQKSEETTDAEVIEVVDAVGDGGDKARRGGIVGLITLPFRLVGAVVRAAVTLVVAVARVLLFPFKLAWAVSSRIVRLAADVVY